MEEALSLVSPQLSRTFAALLANSSLPDIEIDIRRDGAAEYSMLSNPDAPEEVEEGEEEIGELPDPESPVTSTFALRQDEFFNILSWMRPVLFMPLLFALAFVLNHLFGLSLYIVHVILLYRYNQMIIQHMKPESIPEPKKIYSIMFFSFTHTLVCFLRLVNEGNLKSLLFFPPVSPPSFLGAIFITSTIDQAIKFITIITKCGFLSLPFSKKKTNRLLGVVEYSLLYARICLPVPVWTSHILESYSDSEYVLTILLGGYLAWKVFGLKRLATLWLFSVKNLFLRRTFGKEPSQDLLLENGKNCTICQDELCDAIQLDCNHIFCDDCISQWFQRKNTCPLCRQPVPGAESLQSITDGGTNLGFIIF